MLVDLGAGIEDRLVSDHQVLPNYRDLSSQKDPQSYESFHKLAGGDGESQRS